MSSNRIAFLLNDALPKQRSVLAKQEEVLSNGNNMNIFESDPVGVVSPPLPRGPRRILRANAILVIR